jgi:lactose/cellobiose-specific phosphotransferase system IIC component
MEGQKLSKRIRLFFDKIENIIFLKAVREGFTAVMPILMAGAATLVLEYFPIDAYQQFIADALNGKVIEFLDLIYNSTFKMLSVYLSFSISSAYMRQVPKKYNLTPFVSLICFLIVAYSPDMTGLGVQGVFLAMISALVSTKLLVFFASVKISKRHRYIDGSDLDFIKAVNLIIPTLLTVSIFAAANIAVVHIFKVDNVFELCVNAAYSVFLPMGRSVVSAFLITLFSSLLWLFGIHGNNVFEPVMNTLFTPAIDTNMQLVSSGAMPTEIFTKQFFDVFIFMGGCGTTMCLLLAILLFSKRKSAKRLAQISSFPMLFNISELMVFGFPIILNPLLFLPFIIVPLICFTTTYLAMRFGFVPLTISEVNWTAPVLISGYMATGSYAGSILQLINLAIGTLIYRPFVVHYDKIFYKNANKEYRSLVNILKESEESVTPVMLSEIGGHIGSIARSLASDLKYALLNDEITIYYQPQYNNKNEYVSSEALLRWKHPFYGMIYPPLAIKLALERGFLEELEEYVLKKSVSGSNRIFAEFGRCGKVGVNVSAKTIRQDTYFELLEEIASSESFRRSDICLEITEQTVLVSDDATMERINEIRDLGYRLAVDDFSTGCTSLKYLQDYRFDLLKLDGSLIKNILWNTRNLDIVKSIISLADKLECDVIAEYVETEEQRALLDSLGCHLYQGYLYSPAVTLDELLARLEKEESKKEILM